MVRQPLGVFARPSGVSKPRVVIGDFNWKAPYNKLLPDSWVQAPAVPTTKKSTSAAPTRCLAHGLPVTCGGVFDVLGIPHLCAVLYKTQISAEAYAMPIGARRLRRCAVYQWHVKPNTLEQHELRNAADRSTPRSGYTGTLLET